MSTTTPTVSLGRRVLLPIPLLATETNPDARLSGGSFDLIFDIGSLPSWVLSPSPLPFCPPSPLLSSSPTILTLFPFLSVAIRDFVKTLRIISAALQTLISGCSRVLSELSTRAESRSILMMTPVTFWSSCS